MAPLSDSLKKINKFTGWLHDKLNPVFPNLVLLTENWKDPIENYWLKEKMYREWKFRIYIGKMQKKWENIYSKIALENYVGELLKQCRNKKDYFTIELCKPVGDVLNNDEQDKENIMTIQEQKDFLEKMIAKAYGKQEQKKVHIIGLDNQLEHQELLDILHNKWIKWLFSQNKPTLPIRENKTDTFSSIDIAKYLYRVCNQNDQFMKMIYETKSESLRAKEWNKFDRTRNSDFYWMVEIAIRITDFLNGIVVQWGVRRQEKYDKIIRFILDYNLNKELESFDSKNKKPYIYSDFYSLWDKKNLEENQKTQEEREKNTPIRESEREKIKRRHRKIPELRDLQEWLNTQKQRPWQIFYSQYFDTSADDNQDLKEKKLEQKKIKGRLNIVKYATIAAILATFATTKIYNSHKQKKIEEMTLQTMQNIFKDKKVGERANMYSTDYTWEKAAEFIKENYVDRLVVLYKMRYAKNGKIRHMSEDELRLKIISCLNDQKVLSILWNAEERSLNLNLILDEIIIPQYIGEFIANGIETLPYQKYAQYEQGFENILEADSSIFDDRILNPQKIKNQLDPQLSSYKKSKFYRVEPIGDFAIFNPNDMNWINVYGNGMVYYLWLKTRYDPTWTHETPYVVAKWPFWIGDYKCEKTENTERELKISQKVAVNYFLQTKPIITEILNEYIVRYKYFPWSTSDYKYLPHQDMPIRNIRLWDGIIELFIKDIVKNKIYKKIQPGEQEKIIKYIDELVKTQKQQFIDLRENTIPYSFYKDKISLFQRTLQNGHKLPEYRIDHNRNNNKYQTSNLWYYRTSEGKYYHMIIAKINGQEYIYASTPEGVYYEGQENSFGINNGIEIAKDFMKNHYPLIKNK
jgi:hypothetical protein